MKIVAAILVTQLVVLLRAAKIMAATMTLLACIGLLLMWGTA